jgi:2-polyprenyl-6-methoxyphenol hydroxylase-like FAD-dependent oxidoreductase
MEERARIVIGADGVHSFVAAAVRHAPDSRLWLLFLFQRRRAGRYRAVPARARRTSCAGRVTTFPKVRGAAFGRRAGRARVHRAATTARRGELLAALGRRPLSERLPGQLRGHDAHQPAALGC